MRAALALGLLTLTPLLLASAPALDAAPQALLWQPQGGEGDNPATWARQPGVVVTPYRLGLNFPVAFQMMDDGRVYYGEWQTGRVNLIPTPGAAPITLVDLDVLTGGEMGLHEISVRTVDGQDWLYVSYVYGKDSFWGCVLCRDRLSRFPMTSPSTVGAEQVLLDLQGGFVHNGGIILWGPQDGKLYYSRGDASFPSLSQQVNGYTGRILRLNPDGTIPSDNPLGANNPTWAYGLRHTFGMDFLPGTQVIVGTENSDNRADEVNLILPGRNYGWPNTVGYDALLFPERYQAPVRVFERTIGPTNGAFYTGTRLPGWQGSFFYGDTNNGHLYRLLPNDIDGPPGIGLAGIEVVVDTPFLIIDVQDGPDGYLYFNRPEGIYRIEPAIEESDLPGLRLGGLIDAVADLVFG